MRVDDDWILFSLYNDHQRLNTKLSMDIWRSLDSDNPTAILPRSRYVKLYINGEFIGLYLLAEKEDRRLFKLDDAQNSIYSSLIFQAKYWTILDKYGKDCWEQDWPNEDEGIFIMDQILTDLISFINNTSDDVFFDPLKGIFSKFDKLNLIDFYIFNFFIQHKDFWSKNYFIIRQSYPNKFFLIPWDFDSSIGGRWGLYDPEENRESTIRNKNILFDRLLNNEEFKHACKNRWIDIRENHWSEDFILDMASKNYEEIKEILDFELRRWSRNKNNRQNFKSDDQIDELFQWISDRLAFCDLYFFDF
jgi:spore coat protein CotH